MESSHSRSATAGVTGIFQTIKLPEDHKRPTFTTVVDEKSQLIAVYDNEGYRILLIVDQSIDEWYVGGMSGGTSYSDLAAWKQNFETLRATDPGLPYEDYFASVAEKED